MKKNPCACVCVCAPRHSWPPKNIREAQECRHTALLCASEECNMCACVCVHPQLHRCSFVCVTYICQLSVCPRLHLVCQSVNQCMCRKSPTHFSVWVAGICLSIAVCLSLCIFMFVSLPSCQSDVFAEREEPSFSAERFPTERSEKPSYLSGYLWLPVEW